MGSFLSRISDAFASVGTNKSARILLLGLDSAGKTTILYKLKINENVQTIPSNGMVINNQNISH
jgi:ADP-ribosylation factor protein 6